MSLQRIPLRKLAWLFPVALTLHNLEEAVSLPTWSQHAGALHPPVGEFEFHFALLFVTAVGIVVTALASRRGGWFWQLAAGDWALMLLNVFFPHLLATVVQRAYAPGLATALLLNLPVNAYLLLRALRERELSITSLTRATLIALALALVLLPALFALGRSLEAIV
jgi:Protein of unknown function with HXXEE motif